MRKFFLFALVATMFAACVTDGVNDPSVTIEELAPETLTVSFEGDDSRVQLQEGKTVWNKGDLVSIFYLSNANQKWQFQGETGDRSGELKRIEEGTATESMNRVVVVYPYAENYYINPETCNIKASLPAEQSYIADSYGIGGNIMVSYGEYNQVVLKSVCGWLKLQLTGNGEKISAITLKGNNGEQVAGQLYINSADATATLASEMGGAEDNGSAGGNLVFDDTILTEVTLNCGEGVTLGAEPTAFYIALPPQTFSKGISLEIVAADDSKMTKSTDKEVVIERNHILPMAELEFEKEVPETWKIHYTATTKVEPYDKTVFNVNYTSNKWDESTGKGVITFDGEITHIGEKAFYNRGKLISMDIPTSVIEIGKSAFADCYENLEQISIGHNVVLIGSGAFYNCVKLAYVHITDLSAWCKISFESVDSNPLKEGAKLYLNKSELEELVIPSDITEIKKYTFRYCCSLKNVTIPKEITTIGDKAFSECQNLTWVTMSNSVTSIGESAFYRCSNLTSVTMSENITSIGQAAFSGCSSLTSAIISDYVTSIKGFTFYGCSNLERVIIGSNVNNIDGEVFNECPLLTSVYCKPITPPNMGRWAVVFSNISNRKIYVPKDSVNSYKSAKGWSNYASSIEGYDF